MAIGNAEGPVINLRASAIPLVGPGENESTSTACRESGSKLGVERTGLRILAMPEAVKSDLAHNKRSISRHVLETRQVRTEPLGRLEVHVEAHEIEKGQLQILGRWIVDVGDQTLGILGFDDPIEPLQVALDSTAAQPTHGGRRNLVPDRVTQDGGVTGASSHFGPYELLDVGRSPPIDQVADVLFSRQPHHHPEPMALGRVEQMARRHRVGDAHGVKTVRHHLGEVSLDPIQIVVLVPIRVGPKSTVGHASNIELVIVREEELAANARATLESARSTKRFPDLGRGGDAVGRAPPRRRLRY